MLSERLSSIRHSSVNAVFHLFPTLCQMYLPCTLCYFISFLSCIYHQIQWIVGRDTVDGKNVSLFGQAGKALRAGARANKIVRIFVRVLKYSKVLKVFRYTPKASMRLKAVAKVLSETGKVDDVPEKSRVGAAMTDLMNQRYA